MQQESAEKLFKSASKKPKTTSRKKSKGLGDTVEKITEATGIKKIVEAITDDCGCQERKERLNRLFPYSLTMTEEQKKLWKERIEPEYDKGIISADTQKLANQMYIDVLRMKARFTRCGSCVDTRMQRLREAYEASCES